ncbi:MAG TPA: 6,7-dimethyl-8-ribityllumazine synthase, partial [Devosia sp.]|nr:6,7-dimethyl-8-ribityllumazine synthase [Devosia sp.]
KWGNESKGIGFKPLGETIQLAGNDGAKTA